MSIYHKWKPYSIAVTSLDDSQLWIGIIEDMDQASYFTLKSAKKSCLQFLTLLRER